jgi:hypothetical protein
MRLLESRRIQRRESAMGELLGAMETIEHELGAEMDTVDPIPPVFPHRDW